MLGIKAYRVIWISVQMWWAFNAFVQDNLKKNEIPTIYFKYTKVSSQLKQYQVFINAIVITKKKKNFAKLRKTAFFLKSITVFTRLNAAAFITEIFKSFWCGVYFSIIFLKSLPIVTVIHI